MLLCVLCVLCVLLCVVACVVACVVCVVVCRPHLASTGRSSRACIAAHSCSLTSGASMCVVVCCCVLLCVCCCVLSSLGEHWPLLQSLHRGTQLLTDVWRVHVCCWACCVLLRVLLRVLCVLLCVVLTWRALAAPPEPASRHTAAH